MATCYDISVPPFVRGLRVLATLLDKAETHAGASISDLARSRLAPDMYDLVGQVQRATDTAKFGVVRVAGVENMPIADDEQTFDELRSRIAKVIAFIEAVPRSAFEGRDDTAVTLPSRSEPRVYTATSYLIEFALPNFYFHVTTAYDILRANGVPIGKPDYLGWR
jgi:uncharacterized protein